MPSSCYAQAPMKCRIHVDKPRKPVGAIGRLMPRQSPPLVHGILMNDTQVSVMVDSIVNDHRDYAIPLPPEEGVDILGGCPNYRIMWPRSLVSLYNQRQPSMTPSPSAHKGTSQLPLGLSPRILPPVDAGGDEERAMSMPPQLKDSQTTGSAQAGSVPPTFSLLVPLSPWVAARSMTSTRQRSRRHGTVRGGIERGGAAARPSRSPPMSLKMRCTMCLT